MKNVDSTLYGAHSNSEDFSMEDNVLAHIHVFHCVEALIVWCR